MHFKMLNPTCQHRPLSCILNTTKKHPCISLLASESFEMCVTIILMLPVTFFVFWMYQQTMHRSTMIHLCCIIFNPVYVYVLHTACMLSNCTIVQQEYLMCFLSWEYSTIHPTNIKGATPTKHYTKRFMVSDIYNAMCYTLCCMWNWRYQ